jgi:CRP-like cAMP-binding protein
MSVTAVEDVAWVRVRRSTFRRRAFKNQNLSHASWPGITLRQKA